MYFSHAPLTHPRVPQSHLPLNFMSSMFFALVVNDNPESS